MRKDKKFDRDGIERDRDAENTPTKEFQDGKSEFPCTVWQQRKKIVYLMHTQRLTNVKYKQLHVQEFSTHTVYNIRHKTVFLAHFLFFSEHSTVCVRFIFMSVMVIDLGIIKKAKQRQRRRSRRLRKRRRRRLFVKMRQKVNIKTAGKPILLSFYWSVI